MRMSHQVKREKSGLFLRVRPAHSRRSTTWPNYCPVSGPTPQKLPITPSFFPLPGTFAGTGGLAGRETAGSRAPLDSCCSSDGSCSSRNCSQPQPPFPLPPPQPPQRLRTGKQKPEPDVWKSLVLGADRILNKHERQHLNMLLWLLLLFSPLARSKSIQAVLTRHGEHKRFVSEGSVYFNFTSACLPEITWPRATHTQSDDILILVWLRSEASIKPAMQSCAPGWRSLPFAWRMFKRFKFNFALNLHRRLNSIQMFWKWIFDVWPAAEQFH